MKILTFTFLIATVSLINAWSCKEAIVENSIVEQDNILSYSVDPAKKELAFYSKDGNGNFYANHGKLKEDLAHQLIELEFAMNGGMFMEDLRPLGLYIENGKIIRPVNKVEKAFGNFYMQPNGIFYIDDKKHAHISKTTDFELTKSIEYATQSGPMLLIDGKMHPAFNEGSSNLNVRNGVGILPNGDILFAQSKSFINFYDFATFFKKNGCKNALYLDGFVSKTYLPAKDWTQTSGKFGIIIAVVNKK